MRLTRKRPDLHLDTSPNATPVAAAPECELLFGGLMNNILVISSLALLCACASAPAPAPHYGPVIVRHAEARQFCPSNWFELLWLSLYVWGRPPENFTINCSATN